MACCNSLSRHQISDQRGRCVGFQCLIEYASDTSGNADCSSGYGNENSKCCKLLGPGPLWNILQEIVDVNPARNDLVCYRYEDSDPPTPESCVNVQLGRRLQEEYMDQVDKNGTRSRRLYSEQFCEDNICPPGSNFKNCMCQCSVPKPLYCYVSPPPPSPPPLPPLPAPPPGTEANGYTPLALNTRGDGSKPQRRTIN